MLKEMNAGKHICRTASSKEAHPVSCVGRDEAV